MSQETSSIDDLLAEAERTSWKNHLQEKTRSALPGMSDADIEKFLFELGVDTESVVDYCLSHVDECFGKSYMQVAASAGIHQSAALSYMSACSRGSAVVALESSIDVSDDSEPVNQAECRDAALAHDVRNSKSFIPYCQQFDLDPESDAAVRGCVFTSALYIRAGVAFIGGGPVLGLLFLYLRSSQSLFSSVPDWSGASAFTNNWLFVVALLCIFIVFAFALRAVCTVISIVGGYLLGRFLSSFASLLHAVR